MIQLIKIHCHRDAWNGKSVCSKLCVNQLLKQNYINRAEINWFPKHYIKYKLETFTKLVNLKVAIRDTWKRHRLQSANIARDREMEILWLNVSLGFGLKMKFWIFKSLAMFTQHLNNIFIYKFIYVTFLFLLFHTGSLYTCISTNMTKIVRVLSIIMDSLTINVLEGCLELSMGQP